MMIFFDIDDTLIDQRRAERAAAHWFLAAHGAELGALSVASFCAEWRALREKHAPPFLIGAISAHEQRRTGIRERFDPVLVSGQIGAAKPAPEIFLAACRRAEVPAGGCVHVGDRLDHDAVPSRAAGMRSFWLCRRAAHAPPGIERIASLTELAARLDRRSAA